MIFQKRELIEFMIETECLTFGDYTLKSGAHSPFFINLGKVSTGKQLDFLGKSMAALLNEKFPEANIVFGPPYKGITLAVALVIADRRYYLKETAICYARKEDKDHGEEGAYVGSLPGPDDRVVVIDDVLSSGGTKLEAVQSLNRVFGVEPMGIIVAVDRRKRGQEMDPRMPPVHAIVDLNDIADFLKETNLSREKVIRGYHEG